jgi:hypothetical protein
MWVGPTPSLSDQMLENGIVSLAAGRASPLFGGPLFLVGWGRKPGVDSWRDGRREGIGGQALVFHFLTLAGRLALLFVCGMQCAQNVVAFSKLSPLVGLPGSGCRALINSARRQCPDLLMTGLGLGLDGVIDIFFLDELWIDRGHVVVPSLPSVSATVWSLEQRQF